MREAGLPPATIKSVPQRAAERNIFRCGETSQGSPTVVRCNMKPDAVLHRNMPARPTPQPGGGPFNLKGTLGGSCGFSDMSPCGCSPLTRPPYYEHLIPARERHVPTHGEKDRSFWTKTSNGSQALSAVRETTTRWWPIRSLISWRRSWQHSTILRPRLRRRGMS